MYGPRDLCKDEIGNGMIAKNDRFADSGTEDTSFNCGRVRETVAGFVTGKISLRDRDFV